MKKNDADAAAFPNRLTRFLNLVFAFCQMPVRLFMHDEARFGLHEGITRRHITGPGIKHCQPILPRYEYFWCYAAVEPLTGESLFLEMPALDAVCFQIFLYELAGAFPDTLNVLVLDGAPAHVAESLQIPPNILLFRLPPYCPELNPIERLWQDFRARLSLQLPAGLAALAEDAARVVREYTPQILASLTGYDYLRKAYLAQSI